jgi:2-dehydropantoate 2-reductase
MKLLVYGAGVLGSHLAHVLHRAGHDVTILARGQRLKVLKNNGLKIHHYLQRKTTVDNINVTDKLNADDEYDLVFIVMQYQQVKKVLPYIAGNMKTKNFAFIGNNPFPEKVGEFINHNSSVKKNIYFGFFMAAGRIENDCVISAHTGSKNSGSLTIGALNGENLDIFQELKGKIKLDIQNDINSWLKCHAIFVLPVCYAIYACGGDLRKASRKMNNDIIDAITEGYDLIRSIGFIPAPPEDERLVKKHRIMTYALIKFCAVTSIGRLMTSDHAMNATEEMRALDETIEILKKQSDIKMEKWDYLREYMYSYEE